MQAFADELARSVAAQGQCELIKEIATPYVTLVIADLLGVPDDDRDAFRKILDSGPPPGDMDAERSAAVLGDAEPDAALLREVCSGPTRESPRRCADHPGDRQISGRLHAGGCRDRPPRDVSVCRWTGYERQTDWQFDAIHLPKVMSCKRACETIAA